MWLIVVGLVVLAIYLLAKRSTKNFDFHEKQGIKFVKPYPIIGTNVWLFARENIAVALKRYYDEFPNDKIFGLFNFSKPFYVVRDPNLIKQIAVKEFEHFNNRMLITSSKHDEFFGSMLSMMRDKRWKEMRSALSPLFTGSKMRMMFELMSEVGNHMSEYFWEEYSKSGATLYDIKKLFTRFTNDVIATCAFGVSCDSFRNPSNEFFEIGQQFIGLTNPRQLFKLLFISYFPKMSKTLGINIFSKASTDLFYKLIIENMKVREKENIYRPDMINLLIQLRKGELHRGNDHDATADDSIAAVDDGLQSDGTVVKRNWTDTEIIAQCFLFFLAGFETNSGTLRYLAYELAVNPDVQEKLFTDINELHESLDGKPLTYEKIQSLKYLDMVISETLRKWPAGFVTDRQSNKDFTCKDGEGLEFKVKKDMVVWIPIYALHMDPQYFPDPEKFDPDRFSDENRKNINFNAYLPFGLGPRNCIGSRFALMEMKVAIYYLLQKFALEVGPETQVPLRLKKTPNGMVPEREVMLYLRPRNTV